MPSTTVGRRNKDEMNTSLCNPMDLLFAFKGDSLSTILKVYSKYDQNRDKNYQLPENVG